MKMAQRAFVTTGGIGLAIAKVLAADEAHSISGLWHPGSVFHA
jgi:hypothetical protein